MLLGLAAAAASVATTVLTTRAPGMRMRRVPFFSWSALVASIGLLLVLPVLLGVLDLPVRRPPQRPGRCSAATSASASWIGFALTQPATYLFALPAIGITAELIPVDVPQADADARRRLRRARAHRRRRPVGRHPAGRSTTLPWSGSGLDLDDFGDKFDDLVPYALFTLLPILGVVIVLGCRRPRRQARRQRHPAEHHAGVRVRVLRRRHGASSMAAAAAQRRWRRESQRPERGRERRRDRRARRDQRIRLETSGVILATGAAGAGGGTLNAGVVVVARAG